MSKKPSFFAKHAKSSAFMVTLIVHANYSSGSFFCGIQSNQERGKGIRSKGK